jgi:site-specific DNA-cytosine methylase
MKKPKPTAIASYVFAGGFSIGVSKHFDVIAHLEPSPYGTEVVELNQPDVELYIGKGEWPLKDLDKHKIDLVFCNPPCALWSSIGMLVQKGGGAWEQDPRKACWHDCFKIFEKALPRVFVVESVCRAFSPTGGQTLMLEFAERAHEMGYYVTFLFTNSEQCGIAQSRKRFFFVAHREPMDFISDNTPTLNVREALDGIMPDEFYEIPEFSHILDKVGYSQGLREVWEEHVPESQRIRNKQGHVKGRPMFMVHRIHPDKPLGAMAGNYYIHHSEPRFLSVAEMKVLGGYPADFVFPKMSIGKKITYLCQAVMPAVSEWLARQIKIGLDGKKKLTQPVCDYRIVDLRKPLASVEEVVLG